MAFLLLNKPDIAEGQLWNECKKKSQPDVKWCARTPNYSAKCAHQFEWWLSNRRHSDTKPNYPLPASQTGSCWSYSVKSLPGWATDCPSAPSGEFSLHLFDFFELVFEAGCGKLISSSTWGIKADRKQFCLQTKRCHRGCKQMWDLKCLHDFF